MKPLVYRVFMMVILALVAVLIVGSLYAVFRSPDAQPLFRIGGAGSNDHSGQNHASDAATIFSGIGRLRIPVAGPSGQQAATVILSISFPYPAHDRPFTEELASRIGDFRSIASGYFASLPLAKLVNIDEAAAKAEILKQYNALLRLGKIEILYFGDLMIVE
ncbi:MAG: flagellar basal body protein FliL [Treponema sp.]|nr:flagellar basal body protein FliL [Treponema sp.]